nr:MAG TPA: hypothetical protein [Caudoviricetes sp.]
MTMFLLFYPQLAIIRIAQNRSYQLSAIQF